MAINTFLPLAAREKPRLRIGGALRFNYAYSDWKPDSRRRGGDLAYDVFRLNVDAGYRDFLLSVDYRFYPSASGGAMLKSGWLGYAFSEAHQLRLGLVTVPFGILPYTGNNYFFNIDYYVGLEDDADLGIRYLFRKGGWEVDAAFFKNSGLSDGGEGGEVSPSRYAYDIAGRDKETNQGNLRVAYGFGGAWRQRAGASALVGGVYNMDTRKTGLRTAFALHYTLDRGCWGLRLQYARYRIRTEPPAGEGRESVVMAAYGSSYRVASKGDVYTASLSYTIPVGWRFIDSICLYDDFSLLRKRVEGFHDSWQQVAGCSLSMGKVFAYVDYAVGRNHAWLGRAWDGAFAEGSAGGHGARFNINVGYYF